MPNYVYNSLTIKANNKKELDAFLQKAKHEDGEFSFWNFITPPQEALDSGEYWGTNGWEDGERYGDTHNNWYHFNYREWGTKWDAFEVDLSGHYSDELAHIITFTTAWAHPEPVFKAIAEQHPELEFDFSWEEEQGWGGAGIGTSGHFSITEEYDIPNCHAEYVEREKLHICNCQHFDDQRDWYDDCPRETEPASELEQKIRSKIIEGSGVSQEWADKHLIVSVVK